jgi:glycosyltransferase involved in cell wall biosynthesis
VGKYFVILTCRNSQDIIRPALYSIRDQSIKPEYVIVVNDGSSDKTKDILEDIMKDWSCLYLINNPDLGYDISRVVKNWNAAIKMAKQIGPKIDYHMIATDDTVYSLDYAEKIILRMDTNRSLAIASGTYGRQIPARPSGAGRFIRNSFIDETSWKGYYPEQMGYESAILYEAERSGYFHLVVNDAKFQHLRALGKDHKFYEFGASMRTLGYHPLFVGGRFIKYVITGQVTSRIGAVYMIYHYLTYRPKRQGYDRMYELGLRKYIRSAQVERLKGFFLKVKD